RPALGIARDADPPDLSILIDIASVADAHATDAQHGRGRGEPQGQQDLARADGATHGLLPTESPRRPGLPPPKGRAEVSYGHAPCPWARLTEGIERSDGGEVREVRRQDVQRTCRRGPRSGKVGHGGGGSGPSRVPAGRVGPCHLDSRMPPCRTRSGKKVRHPVLGPGRPDPKARRTAPYSDLTSVTVVTD